MPARQQLDHFWSLLLLRVQEFLPRVAHHARSYAWSACQTYPRIRGDAPCEWLWKQATPDGEVRDAAAVRLRAEVLQELGWLHWARAERSALVRDFPPSFPLF